MKFKYLLLPTRVLLRAALCGVKCLFFALPQRIGEEKAPKGLMPFGNPQRVLVGAALSLRAPRREDMKFQRLRMRIKKIRIHFRAKTLASPACHACWQALRQSTTKVHLISLVTLCSVAMPREIQEGTSWHVFLVTSLTCVKEVTPKNRHRSARAEGSQYDRPATKLLKSQIHPSHPKGEPPPCK